MYKHIPNGITLINLLLGCSALVALFAERLQIAVLLFFLAGLMDFSDGLAARLLKAKSPVGKQLDSLADMVSFGLLPSTALYLLLLHNLPTDNPLDWRALVAFLLAASAALRLARFNLDERQTQDFIGLPTPATATFFMGLLIIWSRNSIGLGALAGSPMLLYIALGLLGSLQLAPLPLFSLKFQGTSWEHNTFRYIFVLTSLGLLLWLREVAIPLSILWYLMLGIFKHLTP